MLRDSQKRAEFLLNLTSIVIAVIFLFPIYWIFVNSLKTDAEIFALHPTIIPRSISFKAYIEQVFGEYNIIRAFGNSLIIAVPSMIISIVLSIPAAYGLARFQIFGKKLIIQSFLVTQMMPATLLLAPMFIIYNKIGIINTYMAPILSSCTAGIPFTVLIMRTYFLSIPKELEDSARIDGCNAFTAFLRIITPLASPGIITAATFSFLFAWGDLMYSLTFLNEQAMRPMTAGIYNFMGQYGIQWNKIMAFGTITIIPVVLIFIFLQKYIISGLTSGAVKE